MRSVLAAFGVTGILIACGASNSDSEGSNVFESHDDAASADANVSTADTFADDDSGADTALTGTTYPRCDGGSYTTAPSGAACDATHIVGAGLVHRCYALPKGQFCDDFSFDIPDGADAGAIPSAFRCDSTSPGSRCHLVQPNEAGLLESYHIVLDDAALEAACAVTAAYPDVRVRCVVYE